MTRHPQNVVGPVPVGGAGQNEQQVGQPVQVDDGLRVDRFGVRQGNDRPLGPPKGDATWSGLTATREFAHASVTVDLVTKRARIDWR